MCVGFFFFFYNVFITEYATSLIEYKLVAAFLPPLGLDVIEHTHRNSVSEQQLDRRCKLELVVFSPFTVYYIVTVFFFFLVQIVCNLSI